MPMNCSGFAPAWPWCSSTSTCGATDGAGKHHHGAKRRVLGCQQEEAEDRARRYLDKVGLASRVADQYPARSCPAASSDGWRLPAHWPWSRK